MRNNELRSVRSEIGFLEAMLRDLAGASRLSRAGFEARLVDLRARAAQLEALPADVVAEVLVDNPKIRAARGISVRFGSDMLAGIESTTRAIRQQQEAWVRGQKKQPAVRSAIITAAVNGSFGFRIEEEQIEGAEGNAVPVSSGITELGEIIERLGGSDDEFETFLAETPATVRQEVGKLLGTVAEHDASLKFNNSVRRVEIPSNRVRSAAEKLAADVIYEQGHIRGVLLAVLTTRPKRFEALALQAGVEERFGGPIDPSVSLADLDRMQKEMQTKPGSLVIKKTVWKYQHRERVVQALAGFIPDDTSIKPVPSP